LQFLHEFYVTVITGWYPRSYEFVTAEKLNALDDTRIAVVAAKQWGAVLAEVLKNVITPAKLKLILAVNLTHISDAQLDAFSEEVILALDVEQLKQVGKAVDAELQAVQKVASKLEEERADILKQRQEALAAAKAAKATETSATAEGEESYLIWYIIAAVVGIIIIAGVVFVIVRRD